MPEETHCPTCGARLPASGDPCPFCLEAQRLLQSLSEEQEVHLCTRCGALLPPGEEGLCAECYRRARALPSPWRREDRIARWIRDRFVEPMAEREGVPCPSCGRVIPPMAVFCLYCGYRLAGGAPEPAPVQREEPAVDRLTGGATNREEVAMETVPGVSSGPVPAESEPRPKESSFLKRARAFLQDQFSPLSQGKPDSPPVPLGRQLLDFFRNLFRPVDRTSAGSQTLLWILAGLLFLGLLGMIFFWANMLRSGGITFIR